MSSGATRTRGFRHQRHVEALHSESKHFTTKNLAEAKVNTGVTLAYAIHEFPGDDGCDGVERVVMIMGCMHIKECWTINVEMMMQQWAAERAEEDPTKPRKTLQVLTFDNRGIGDSEYPYGIYTTSLMAQDALGLMDYLGWQQAHIVGQSLGGMISLELAHMAPKRVRSLSLIVTTRGRYMPSISNSWLLMKTVLHYDIGVMSAHMTKLLYPEPFLDTPLDDDTDKKAWDVLFPFHRDQRLTRKIPTPHGSFGQISAVASHWVSDERLQEIADHGFPILIVGASQDKVIPPQETLRLQERLRGDHVKTVIFDDAGHNVYIQYADEVTEFMLDTLQRAM
ncbi:TPA: hypothetical protein N0F65_007517 [Lagenidium giganteum]|uniref:AB hydrolase-1 domain-containing protein n=1 Tax=Lagenidium giganteum TaxID=4803 RepID=A0AAV2ZIN6_9STRA|nr:TPA: hypothetical protein N0F65_007517 [Lagenidium giganteum]